MHRCPRLRRAQDTRSQAAKHSGGTLKLVIPEPHNKHFQSFGVWDAGLEVKHGPFQSWHGETNNHFFCGVCKELHVYRSYIPFERFSEESSPITSSVREKSEFYQTFVNRHHKGKGANAHSLRTYHMIIVQHCKFTYLLPSMRVIRRSRSTTQFHHRHPPARTSP